MPFTYGPELISLGMWPENPKPTTTQRKASMSTQEILKAAEHLSPQELNELLEHVLHLRAQRMAPSLSPGEAGLLEQVNSPFPQRRRYRQLIAKRRAGTLTPSEQEELKQLTEQEERHNVRCVEALARLAELRGKGLAEMMSDLGLEALHDA
jgi:hypothetical protein